MIEIGALLKNNNADVAALSETNKAHDEEACLRLKTRVEPISGKHARVQSTNVKSKIKTAFGGIMIIFSGG